MSYLFTQLYTSFTRNTNQKFNFKQKLSEKCEYVLKHGNTRTSSDTIFVDVIRYPESISLDEVKTIISELNEHYYSLKIEILSMKQRTISIWRIHQ